MLTKNMRDISIFNLLIGENGIFLKRTQNGYCPFSRNQCCQSYHKLWRHLLSVLQNINTPPKITKCQLWQAYKNVINAYACEYCKLII